MSGKRVLIVDVMHLCYKAAFGGMPALSCMVKDAMGNNVYVSTTIPSYVIKRIFDWSKGGYFPTVVCFDSKGGNRSRNAYFAQFREKESDERAYKSNRTSENTAFYDSCDLTANKLYMGGVGCLKSGSYEADDLVKAAVDLAKKTYPDLPIDIVTGDTDLVPLVDDQVSVFLSSRKGTYATEDRIKKAFYVQLTPENYQEYIESLTNYKNLYVPYNTLLLAKLLRGDKSDGIDGYPKFTPTKYKNLINSMAQDGVDFSRLFRYDNPVEIVSYAKTGLPIPQDMIASVPDEEKTICYGEPKTLTEMCNVLSNYLDEDVIRHVRQVYNGINLNAAFDKVDPLLRRRPARLTMPIRGYSGIKLQEALDDLSINLSKKYL